MERRKFLQQTGMTAFAVFAFGKVSWSETNYVGDTITTTDVLGPFYRPGAPLRKNINPSNFEGKLFHLTGRIFKADGKSPLNNCKIEIWQCGQDRLYDNTSDEYKYRGTQYTDKKGQYHFITTHPIAYPATEDPNKWRTAHIHMLISVKGHQDLITQIFFKGEPYVETDGPASASDATSRILTIKQNDKGEETVEFNVVMAKEFKPSENVYNTIIGLYKMDDKSIIEFYKKDDLLFFKKNGQIMEGLSYYGNNEFIGGSMKRSRAKFEIQESGNVKLNLTYYRPTYNDEKKLEGTKAFKYEQ